MIRTVSIHGFKSIQDLDIELGRINCLIGANGSGKSNILEAIGVLGAAANGAVDDEALLRRGVRPGLPRLYKSSFATAKTPVHIGLKAIADTGAEYRISILNPLENPNPAWEFKTEYLADGKIDLVSDGVRNKKNVTPNRGLAALTLVDHPSDNPAARLMKTLQEYAIYSPTTPTLRGMVPDAQSREPLGLAGGRLAEAFEDFKKTVVNKNGDILDEVLELVDWVKDIDTTIGAGDLLSPSVSRTTTILKFTDRFMNKTRNTLTAYDASEGALYVLFVAILALSSKTPSCIAVDNLDQALNPRLASALIKRLCSWTFSKHNADQILFTAHNPAVLDGLDIGNDDVRLFAVSRNSEGQTTASRIMLNEELKALHKEYPLSRLWMMGSLGAVPNV